MPVPPLTEPWQPAYTDEGIEPLVNNLLGVFKRDQAAALDFAKRDGELIPFKVFNNSRRRNQDWPVISVVPRQEATPADGQLIQGKSTLEVGVEVKGPDLNQLVQLVMRYVRAARAMVWAARLQDWTAGMTVLPGSTFSVELSPTVYVSFIDKNQTSYVQYAIFTVTVDFLGQ